MEEQKVKINALDISEENPFYKKYLKKKDKFIKKLLQKMDRRILGKQRGFTSEYFLTIIDDKDEYFFLCYMTRKYFLDNIIINLIRIVFCIVAIIGAQHIELHFKRNIMKGPLMVLLFAYGIFHGPLSFLYVLANGICFLRYRNYVSNMDSLLAKKIIVFYDSETDKFAGQNYFNTVKTMRKAKAERKRVRGW